MATVELMSIDSLKPHPLSQEIYGLPEENDGEIKELVESIRQYGVLEPLIITESGFVIDGCRRLTAARQAGLQQVPAEVIHNVGSDESKKLIVTLNLHRQRLSSTMVREALLLAGYDGKSEEKVKISDRIIKHVGFRNKPSFERALKVVLSGKQDIVELMDNTTIASAYRKLHRTEKKSLFSSIIKPSDNWNFSPVRYPRIDGLDTYGYIPGDIYANCFWYFVKPSDVVVDPMAGSGMAQYVYDHRSEWMGEQLYEFELLLFDLNPQSEKIQRHNLLESFPTKHADYIFIDLPYLGMSKGQYSNDPNDLGNMDELKYQEAVARIANLSAKSQKKNKLCTVISPNYVDHGKRKVINMVEFIRDTWRQSSYRLYLETYSSRRIQQMQNPTMAKLNNLAKERRLPLTDITVVMTFEKTQD